MYLLYRCLFIIWCNHGTGDSVRDYKGRMRVYMPVVPWGIGSDGPQVPARGEYLKKLMSRVGGVSNILPSFLADDDGRREDGFEDVGVKLQLQAVVLQLALEVNPLLCHVDKWTDVLLALQVPGSLRSSLSPLKGMCMQCWEGYFFTNYRLHAPKCI